MRGRLTATPLAKSRKATRIASMQSAIGNGRFTSSSVMMIVTRCSFWAFYFAAKRPPGAIWCGSIGNLGLCRQRGGSSAWEYGSVALDAVFAHHRAPDARLFELELAKFLRGSQQQTHLLALGEHPCGLVLAQAFDQGGPETVDDLFR